MDKTVIFIVIVIICVLCTVWSACVMAARADEQLREITYDKKEPEEKEEDMTKQRTCKYFIRFIKEKSYKLWGFSG